MAAEAAAKPAPRQHVPALDGIRGLAILLILAHHLLIANKTNSGRVMLFLQSIPEATWAGVDLFFVLSGFLITGILFDSLADEGFFRKFYARRTVRIFPLYYGFLLLVLALTGPLQLHWQHMLPALFLYLQNTTIFQPIFQYHPSERVQLSHLWSLAVEEQFYLVWPLLVFWIKDLRRLIVTCLSVSALVLVVRVYLRSHGTDPDLLYVFTPFRADSLLLGAALALAMRSPWRARVLAQSKLFMALGAAGVLLIVLHDHQFSYHEGFLTPAFGFTLVAIFSGGLLADTFRDGSWLRPAFEMRWLRFLGKYSYGIYVFHFPLNSYLTIPVRDAILHVTQSRLVVVLGGGLVITVLSILAAVLSFNLYERQFLRLKKYFEYSKPAGA